MTRIFSSAHCSSSAGIPTLSGGSGAPTRSKLLLSDADYAELVNVFSRPRLIERYRVSAETLAELLAGIAEATLVQPSPTVPVQVRDPKDVKIRAAALGGDAEYLVTGDADLLVHRNDFRLGKLRIITVTEFLAILDEITPRRGDDPSGTISTGPGGAR